MMRWKSNWQEAFRERYTREAKDTERKIVEYYRKHPSEVPDGSFVMNLAVRYHEALERSRKRKGIA